MNILLKFIKQYWLSTLLAVLGVTLTIAAYFIPKVEVDIKWLIGLFIILFSFLLAEGKMIWDLARDKKLLSIDRIPKKYHSGENALVLRRSEEVSINSLVGIYEILDGEMERIIAIGEVYNQTEKISQVRILKIELTENETPLSPAILFADEKLREYRIKPHIPAEFFRNIPEQGEHNGRL
jgi:hypothetical protein